MRFEQLLPRLMMAATSGGTGCCAAFMAAAVEMGIPSLGRAQLNFVVIRGAGITPDALPEPPKSLV